MSQDDIKRAAAFQSDTELVPTMSFLDSWSVIGNNSSFIYKDKLDEPQAIAYAAELNKNKEDSKRYEEA